MKAGKITDWKNILQPTPLLEKAFAWIEEHVDGKIETGCHIIDDDKLFVNVGKYRTSPIEEGLFEAHQKYIDIQVIIKGKERIYYTSPDGLTVNTEYDGEKDAVLYEQPAELPESILVEEGSFAEFSPDKAHMPGRHPEEGKSSDIIKFVAKVKIS